VTRPKNLKPLLQQPVSVDISADFLLRGTFFAMEHAWHLLEDAVELFRLHRYSSCLTLSVLCLEELGRAELYSKETKRAFDGKDIDFGLLERQCKRHIVKLTQGQIPVNAAVFGIGEIPMPGTAEEAKLAAQLRRIRKLLERLAPGRAQKAKLRALYVEPSADGKRWSRPSSIAREEAEEWLSAADYGYLLIREKIANPPPDSPIAKGTERWLYRPNLPKANWDPWDWSQSA
jgi:AbiV family abortive infection protein